MAERNFYDICAKKYHLLSGFEERKWISSDFYLTTFPSLESKILDIWCGNGEDVCLLQQLWYTAFGCDTSSSMIDVARSRTSFPHTFFHQDGLSFLSQSNSQYSGILCLGNTLTHMSDEYLQDFIPLVFEKLIRWGKFIFVFIDFWLLPSTTFTQWDDDTVFVYNISQENSSIDISYLSKSEKFAGKSQLSYNSSTLEIILNVLKNIENCTIERLSWILSWANISIDAKVPYSTFICTKS